MRNVNDRDIQRTWHLIDAKKQILGRLSSKIAETLMGKNKSYFTPHLDTGDYVVVVNAAEVMFSGKKEKQKKYWRHSGYPGGLYVKTTGQIRGDRSESLIRHAVVGMLPKTKLGKLMVKKLYIFAGSEHPYGDKFATIESNERTANT